MDSLGDRISKARIAKGMTQEDVATKMEYSVSLVSFWETGRATPSKEQLKRLEEILGKLDPPSVGDWLLSERRSKNWSQRELANRANVALATIGNIENNRTRPQQSIIDRIRKAFDIDMPEEIEGIVENLEDDLTPDVSDAKTFKPYDDTTWPSIGGVYVFFDTSHRPIYIGQSKNIRRRIEQHAEKKWYIDPLVKFGRYIEIEDEDLRRSIERALIRLLSSYLLINKQLKSVGYTGDK